jgi:hypothetical protein
MEVQTSSIAAERKSPIQFKVGKGQIKFGLSILCSLFFLALSFAQENPPSRQAGSPPVGLGVGQRAPVFSSTDQFGHVQSNETLKGSDGTVLLFSRSADW